MGGVEKREGVSCGHCCFYGYWTILTNGSYHGPVVAMKIIFTTGDVTNRVVIYYDQELL